MSMNILASIMLIALSFAGQVATQTPKVQAEDLRRLAGAEWTGTLTYLDYRANKKVSILSNLTVSQSVGDTLSWVFEYKYPDEPKANSKRTVTINDVGTVFNGETVLERTSLDDGTLKIVTEQTGSDNDRRALFRYTYLLGPSNFSITKEVRVEGATEFFERNQYSWKR